MGALRPLSVIFGVVIAVAAIGLLITEVPRFSDPCIQWGVDGWSGQLPSSGPCRDHVEGTSETKIGAMTRLFLVHGGIILASVFGIIGALRRIPVLSFMAGVLFLLEAIPLVFSFAPLMFVASALFFSIARPEQAPRSG